MTPTHTHTHTGPSVPSPCLQGQRALNAPKDFGIKFPNLECEFLRHELCPEWGSPRLTPKQLMGGASKGPREAHSGGSPYPKRSCQDTAHQASRPPSVKDSTVRSAGNRQGAHLLAPGWGVGVRHPTVPHPTVPANTHHPLGIHQAPTSQPLLADTRQGQMTVVALGRTHPYPSSTAEGASPSSCLSLESLCAAPQLGRGGAESRKPTTKALWAQKPVHGRLRSRRWLISSNNEQRFCKTP